MKTIAAALLFAAVTFIAAGCDGGPGPDDRPRDGGTGHVFAREIDFNMADATVVGTVATVQYDFPDITFSVVKDGAVLAFFREQDTWTAMPYTYGVESRDLPAVDYTVTLGYAYEHRFLEVFYEVSTDAIDPRRDLPNQRIKVVIIDSFFAGKSGIDLTDWAQVRDHFGLED